MLVTGERQRQRETKHSLGKRRQTKTALKKGTATSPEQGQQIQQTLTLQQGLGKGPKNTDCCSMEWNKINRLCLQVCNQSNCVLSKAKHVSWQLSGETHQTYPTI